MMQAPTTGKQHRYSMHVLMMVTSDVHTLSSHLTFDYNNESITWGNTCVNTKTANYPQSLRILSLLLSGEHVRCICR